MLRFIVFAKSIPGLWATLIFFRKVVYWIRFKRILPRLHPVGVDKPLIRLGPLGDGGYLLPDDLEGVTACFSPGVSSVSGFEKDCADRGMNVYLADASVDAPAEAHPLFTFTKKFIGGYAREGFITLEDWLASSSESSESDLIMQMDIEHFEYEVLDHVSSDLIKRFRIIVIEFHGLDRFSAVKYRVFSKILNTHTCVHIHPNNYRSSEVLFDLEIPPTMEFTFLRDDRLEGGVPRSDFPHQLDSDNTSHPSVPLPKCWYV